MRVVQLNIEYPISIAASAHPASLCKLNLHELQFQGY
jgi:hypothetical protein